ncbi:hypothetical protein BH09BAC5_BH09BAC5_27300 [soil metagenome]
MKKTFIALIILIIGITKADAQQEKFAVFGVNIYTQLGDYDEFNADMDTIEANSNVGAPGKIHSNFGYGLSFISKVGYAELGAHVFLGNSKENYIQVRDTVSGQEIFSQLYVRHHMVGLSGRIGFSSGKTVSIGADVGGILSNFQHEKVRSDKVPNWLFKSEDVRSYVGTITPYSSIHGALSEQMMFFLEPYASFVFGKMNYAGAFAKEIYYPNASIKGSFTPRFFGIRIILAFGKTAD